MRAPDGSRELSTSSHVDSLAEYVVPGAAVGFFSGLVALADFNRTHKGAVGLAVVAGSTVVGFLVGLELHRSRSWSRFGWLGQYARWIVAGSLTASTAALALLTVGAVPARDLWQIVGIGAVGGAGFCFSLQADEWRNRALRGPVDSRRLGWIVLAGALAILVAWAV